MTTARIVRAKRLIDIRKRAVTDAQVGLAGAVKQLVAAELDADRARSLWEDESNAMRVQTDIAAGELSERHTRSRFLYDAWRHADHRRRDAALVVQERRDAVVAAQAEQRKLEVWQERMIERAHEERTRVERAETDALGARMMRRAR